MRNIETIKYDSTLYGGKPTPNKRVRVRVGERSASLRYYYRNQKKVRAYQRAFRKTNRTPTVVKHTTSHLCWILRILWTIKDARKLYQRLWNRRKHGFKGWALVPTKRDRLYNQRIWRESYYRHLDKRRATAKKRMADLRFSRRAVDILWKLAA